jgi:hypothetical protein
MSYSLFTIPAGTYYMRVLGVNGFTPLDNPLELTEPFTLPAPPSMLGRLILAGQTATSVTLSWLPVSGFIGQYIIAWSGPTVGIWLADGNAAGTTLLTGLSAGSYQFSIVARSGFTSGVAGTISVTL